MVSIAISRLCLLIDTLTVATVFTRGSVRTGTSISRSTNKLFGFQGINPEIYPLSANCAVALFDQSTLRGLSTSRSRSPIRLMATTAISSAIPG